MPVDALLGIPDMSKLLNESKYEVTSSHLSQPDPYRNTLYTFSTARQQKAIRIY
jgi:hypothetical protein